MVSPQVCLPIFWKLRLSNESLSLGLSMKPNSRRDASSKAHVDLDSRTIIAIMANIGALQPMAHCGVIQFSITQVNTRLIMKMLLPADRVVKDVIMHNFVDEGENEAGKCC